MTQLWIERSVVSADEQNVTKWIRRLIWKMAIATLLLMAIGSATRVMNAGLACPDWPLCYGQLIPSRQMNLQVFLEWFHRLDAGLIGLSAIALVGLCLWFRSLLPHWLPWAAGFALFLIVFQGILGGLTVTQLLRFDIVTAHLGTALIFFCTLLVMGCCLTPYRSNGTANKLPWVAIAAASFVYIQDLLGGLVGSRWALHQCFYQDQLCVVMNSHLIGVVPATLATFSTLFLAWRTPALHPLLRKLSKIAAILVVVQILFGIATFKLHLQVEPLTVTHHTIGATLLGTLVILSVFALRDRQLSTTM